jgi:effector-binding domain-containing protein
MHAGVVWLPARASKRSRLVRGRRTAEGRAGEGCDWRPARRGARASGVDPIDAFVRRVSVEVGGVRGVGLDGWECAAVDDVSDDIFAWWQGALGELHATVRAQGLTATGATGGLYASALFQHGRGEATVFIPTDGTVKAIGRVVSLIIPAAELAVARHSGSPSDIDLTYGELGAYVIKHEISVDGPLRENYLRGITETDVTGEWETEIGWPIFRTHD